MTRKSEKAAFYGGSFDPFTIGHYSIVTRALNLFDSVVIAIGENVEKRCRRTVEERMENIRRIFRDVERVKVVAFKGLAVEAAKSCGCCCLLRGVRSVADYEAERNMAEANRLIGGPDTVLLFAEPELACISSSMVRELEHFGVDTSPFLPLTED